MESYKDVMLSEPPSHFATAPSVHPVNLETYKGILLCDRPAAAADKNFTPVPFLPGGKCEDKFIGIQPSNEQRCRTQLIKATAQSRVQSNNAIVLKHKRWLRSFAAAMKQIKLDQTESQLVSQTRAAHFKEKEARLRQDAKQCLSYNVPNVIASGGLQSAPPQSDEAEKLSQQKQPKSKEKGMSKPKWAMTEEEAEQDEDMALLSKHNDLLKFAENLDYEKFINDYEVQEALAIMKERVEEIVQENGDVPFRSHCAEGANSDPRTESAPPTRQVLAAPKRELAGAEAKHNADWNPRTKTEILCAAISAEALHLADKLLSTSDSLRKVHTRHSLAKVLQDAVAEKKSKLARADNPVDSATIVMEHRNVTPPKVAVISQIATGFERNLPEKRILTDLRKASDKTQNLPYLYRCPAL